MNDVQRTVLLALMVEFDSKIPQNLGCSTKHATPHLYPYVVNTNLV